VPGDPSILIGAFALKLVAETDDTPAFSSLLGRVFDGATPQGVLFDESVVDGECRLLVPRVPFCATPCGSAVCVDDDVCVAFPSSQSIGAVTVRGLPEVFVMEPVANNYQPPASLSLPFDALAVDATMELAAAGSAFTPGFTRAGSGIAPLQLTSEDFVVDDGAPLGITWTPGNARARVRLTLDISHHGGTRGKIECDADDDGDLVLSAPLLDALVDLGVAGFPTVIVAREAVTSTVIGAGRIDLVVSSTIERSIEIPGLVSCSGDDGCDDGDTCQTDLTCG
jgi:hypothetical protein